MELLIERKTTTLSPVTSYQDVNWRGVDYPDLKLCVAQFNELLCVADDCDRAMLLVSPVWRHGAIKVFRWNGGEAAVRDMFGDIEYLDLYPFARTVFDRLPGPVYVSVKELSYAQD